MKTKAVCTETSPSIVSTTLEDSNATKAEINFVVIILNFNKL